LKTRSNLRSDAYAYFSEHAPIHWHPTTVRKFECELGCINCCLHPFYFPSEVSELPATVKQALTYKRKGKQKIIVPKTLNGVEGTCTFFDKNRKIHCTVFAHRPLRCRLYPYLPIIEKDHITIVLEPFLKRYSSAEKAPWFRCYGIGNGRDVSEGTENLSRAFIAHVLSEYPLLLHAYAIDDVDSEIADWVVMKYQHPEYLSWQDAKPVVQRQMLRIEALTRQRGSKRLSTGLASRDMMYLSYLSFATQSQQN
jgi:Fe-S-cluster containining protein